VILSAFNPLPSPPENPLMTEPQEAQNISLFLNGFLDASPLGQSQKKIFRAY